MAPGGAHAELLVGQHHCAATVSRLHFAGSFAVGVAGRELGHWEVMQGAQEVRSGLMMLQVVAGQELLALQSYRWKRLTGGLFSGYTYQSGYLIEWNS